VPVAYKRRVGQAREGGSKPGTQLASAANSLQHISWADILLLESTNQNTYEPALRTSLIGLAQVADSDAFACAGDLWRNKLKLVAYTYCALFDVALHKSIVAASHMRGRLHGEFKGLSRILITHEYILAWI
jgi:hypothetical protein